jgi:hypothetical protein
METDDDPPRKQIGAGKVSNLRPVEQLMDQFAFDWDAPMTQERWPDRDVTPSDHCVREQHPSRGRGRLQRQVSKGDLVRLYHDEGLSLQEIAQKFGVTRPAVHQLLKSHGIETRDRSKARVLALSKGKFEGKSTATLHESLFSQWSQPMAYLLGYIFTDGSLVAVRGGYIVTISSTDDEHLEKLAAILGEGVPIRKYKQSKKGFSGTEDRYIHSISFTRPTMMEDLCKLGLTERKSLTMPFPDVPEEFLRDFIRGCWDGDGSIMLRDRWGHKSLVAVFTTGSLAFVSNMRARLQKYGFGRLTIHTQHSDGVKTKNPAYRMMILSSHAIAFCQFLYDDVPDEFLLARKFLIYKRVAPDLTRTATARDTPQDGRLRLRPGGSAVTKVRRSTEAHEDSQTCAATQRDGLVCTLRALPGSQFCVHHQPYTGERG